MIFRRPSNTCSRRGSFLNAAASLLLGLSPAVSAEEAIVERATTTQLDRALEVAKGHPNEFWRLHGIRAFNSGRHQEALEYFTRAAKYADKYSQHYLSLMCWEGQGAPRDRAQAYIWSDLAAERGLRRLLLIREKMWSELSAEERQRAVAQGAAFYERYGDEVAKPRTEAEIRWLTRKRTGSRLGYATKRLEITAGGPANGSFGQGSHPDYAMGGVADQEMYGEDRIDRKRYWRAQDAELAGLVEVGELQVADRKVQE